MYSAPIAMASVVLDGEVSKVDAALASMHMAAEIKHGASFDEISDAATSLADGCEIDASETVGSLRTNSEIPELDQDILTAENQELRRHSLSQHIALDAALSEKEALQGEVEKTKAAYETLTRDYQALVAWLRQHGMQTPSSSAQPVAKESQVDLLGHRFNSLNTLTSISEHDSMPQPTQPDHKMGLDTFPTTRFVRSVTAESDAIPRFASEGESLPPSRFARYTTGESLVPETVASSSFVGSEASLCLDISWARTDKTDGEQKDVVQTGETVLTSPRGGAEMELDLLDLQIF